MDWEASSSFFFNKNLGAPRCQRSCSSLQTIQNTTFKLSLIIAKALLEVNNLRNFQWPVVNKKPKKKKRNNLASSSTPKVLIIVLEKQAMLAKISKGNRCWQSEIYLHTSRIYLFFLLHFWFHISLSLLSVPLKDVTTLLAEL